MSDVLRLKNNLKHALGGLEDGRLGMLFDHVERKTPILHGEPAGEFFTHGDMSDPIILACYENEYPDRYARYADLHPSVQHIYESVSHRLEHSDYAVSLELLEEFQIRSVIRVLGCERGI